MSAPLVTLLNVKPLTASHGANAAAIRFSISARRFGASVSVLTSRHVKVLWSHEPVFEVYVPTLRSRATMPSGTPQRACRSAAHVAESIMPVGFKQHSVERQAPPLSC